MSDIATRISDRLLRGAWIAALMVTVTTQFLLCLPQLVTSSGRYHAVWPEWTAFGLLTTVAAGSAWFAMRHREIPMAARWPGTILTFGASILATSAVPAGDHLRPEHWSFGLIAWYGVLLFLHSGLRAIATFTGVHLLLTATQLLLTGPPSLPVLANMGITALSACGFVLAVAVAFEVFRRVADRAAAVATTEDRLRTAEAIGAQRHRDHRERYAALAHTAVPLLSGLADESLDPSDADVRRRCAVEAAKLRRLFAEADDVSDRLVHELGAGVDVAERKGISVQFAVRGEPRELPAPIRRELVEPASAAMTSAISDVRATIVRTPSQVRVSVVSDAPAHALPAFRPRYVEVATVVTGDRLWMEVTWRPATSR
ncbi:hypothetical protein SAMN05421504_113171 [Amycolatopsis xylanica]|uniref:Signal transduction histidine kinase n=1 Tax=Amycolatopsis xylanica TaxID=589385 RepID=A0A1H3SFJ9_9PSEU|nr:hypothetical protein [Amycolatopsis xylanica]SDZ36430.1 hypothetical protein SAMN05421504_113171 [Amycolatopsis xylanica]